VRRVFSRWQFSKELAASAIHHHDPISKLRRLPSDERPQAAITAMANELAHALALCDGANTMIGRLDPWVEYLGVPASLIEEISSRVPDEVETLKLALLSHTSDKVWSTASTDLRRQLALPLRPVTIALSPATCSFRLFANRLADHSSNDTEAGPNLAIVYIRGKSEEEKLFADLATLERRAGDGPLPTVIIHTTAPPNTEQAMLKQRPLRMLPAPTSQQRFLEAMGDLLRGREAQPAGALEAQV